MFEELAEILVLAGLPINFHHVLQSVLTQVADCGDLAIGVQMPLEGGTKVPTYNSYPDNFIAGRSERNSLRRRDPRDC
jgi:hypothetical protein